MTNQKYSSRVSQVGESWTGEIVRRVSARRTMVSKSQAGFATEAEANTWGEEALKAFLANLNVRNERKASKREQRNEAEQAKALAAALAQEAREDAAEDDDSEEDSDKEPESVWDLDDDLED